MSLRTADEPTFSSQRTHATGFLNVCAVPLLVGVVIRLALGQFTSVSLDMGVWATAVRHAMEHIQLYHAPGFSYPPVWGYLLHAGGYLAQVLGVSPQSVAASPEHWRVLALRDGQLSALITTPIATLAIKLPLICSDILVAWLVWHIAITVGMSTKGARFAVVLWFLNPLVIFVTAVHGACDTLIALAVVAAVLARFRQRFFFVGVALAFGVLTKIVPAFLAPLFLATCLWPMGNEKEFDRWRALLQTMLGGILTALAIVLPLLLGGTIHAAWTDIFTRTSTPGSIGGLSWLGFSSLPVLSPVANWALQSPNGLSTASVLADFVVAFGAAAIWIRARQRRDHLAFLAIALAAFVLVVLIGPLANPQYLLWFLPLLALLAWRDRRLLVTAAALSVAGLIYEIAVQAPFGFLTPMSLAFGVPSGNAIVADRLDMLSQSFLTVPIGRLLEFIAWMMAAAAAAVTVWVSASIARNRSALPADLVSPSLARRTNTVLSRHLRLLSASMLAVPAALGLLPVFGPGSTPVNLSVGVPSSSTGAVDVSWRFTSPPPVGTNVSALETLEPQRLKKIFVYSDPAYPMSGSSPYAVQGVIDHLPVDLTLDNVRVQVAEVNATGLRAVLNDTRASSGRVVIDVSGTLPNLVWSQRIDDVTPFLEAGGTLVWAGDEPGYYSVGRAPTLDATNPPQRVPEYRCGRERIDPGPPLTKTAKALGPSGVTRLLGTAHLLSRSWGWNCVASNPSPVAAALGLTSSTVHAGPSLNTLARIRGTNLGYAILGRSSIAWIPRGKGGVLLFSGTVDATDVSSDVAALLATSGAHPDPRVVANFGAARSGRVALAPSSGICRVRVAIVATNEASSMFVHRRTIAHVCTRGERIHQGNRHT